MSDVYIAGPMTGLPGFNYPAFYDAAVRLSRAGHEPFNPANIEALNDTGEPKPWDWYMRHALANLIWADGVALLPGWESSKGATLEHHVALQLGLDVRPLDGWLG
jgi:hypothetical protein